MSPPAEPTILNRIMEQAGLLDDATAIEDDAGSISYRELPDLVLSIAVALNARGVRPGDRVAVHLRRSRMLAVAVLGVLRAGATYVPIDPDLPRERVARMLADAQVELVIAADADEVDLGGASAVTVTVEQLCAELPARTLGSALSAAPDAGGKIYVIFTSGSTGRPKGVIMPEAVIANLLEWQWRVAKPPVGGRTAQLSALGFDVAAQEMFFTLGAGGTLVCVKDAARRDPAQLLRFLIDRRIDRIFVPFAALAQLAVCGSQRGMAPPLREVVTAGEQLIVTPAIRAWFAQMPGAVLRNQYGPTETHVVTELVLDGDPAAWPERPSIGRPIDGVSVRVLDEAGQPVPDGEEGELCAMGACLADGYLGDPELTRERFREVEGRRLYATGDFGRVLDDGNIAFSGRRDDQVKLRGFRVELGECDLVLSGHPAVTQALCAVDRSREQPRLIAFLVADGRLLDRSDENVQATLQEWMAERVPAHSVPSRFVRVEAIPTTATGKSDRQALLERHLPERRSRPAAPPQGGLSGSIAASMAKILGEPIGSDEDFFLHGGDSIAAARLAHDLWAFEGIEMGVSAVFEARTADALARRLGSGRAVPRSAPVIEPAANEPVPVSAAQRRFWIGETITPGNVENLAPIVVRCEGRVDTERLAEALVTLVERHESLRTAYRDTRTEILQETLAPAPPPLTVIDTSVEPSVLLGIANTTLDPLVGRPIAAAVSKSDGGALLALALHHICTDAESQRVLLTELDASYQGMGLPEAAPGMRAYARWHQEFLASVAPDQLGYWSRQLADLPPPIHRAPTGTAVGRTEVAVDGLRELEEAARGRATTVFASLLAAFFLALREVFATDDPIAAVPVSGRRHPAFKDAVGCFINTLALRPRTAAPDGPLETERAVTRTLVEGLANLDVPFDDVVAALPASSRTIPAQLPIFSIDPDFPTTLLGHPARRCDSWHPGGPIGPLALILKPDGAAPSGLKGALFHRGLHADRAEALAAAFEAGVSALASSAPGGRRPTVECDP